MLRAFLRSSAPIALLLVLGLFAVSLSLVMPASTTMSVDGVETTSGPDLTTAILAGTLFVLGVAAFATAAVLSYRRRRRRRSAQASIARG